MSRGQDLQANITSTLPCQKCDYSIKRGKCLKFNNQNRRDRFSLSVIITHRTAEVERAPFHFQTVIDFRSPRKSAEIESSRSFPAVCQTYIPQQHFRYTDAEIAELWKIPPWIESAFDKHAKQIHTQVPIT